MQEQKYHGEIKHGKDGNYTGQVFYRGKFLTGSTFISADRDEVLTKLQEFVQWYEAGNAKVEVVTP